MSTWIHRELHVRVGRLMSGWYGQGLCAPGPREAVMMRQIAAMFFCS